MSSVPAKLNPVTTNAAETTESDQGGRLPVSRFALFFALMFIGLAADLWTKSYVFQWLYDPIGPGHQVPYWLIDGVFGFQCSFNPGALFGIGKGYSGVFAGFSFVALAGILVWLFVFKAALDRWLTFALGLISGGILGNLYDRLGFGWQAGYPEATIGNVRDWILFRLEGVPFFDPWPNFNIADSLLVSGAIMLFVHAIFWADSKEKPSNSTVVEETQDE